MDILMQTAKAFLEIKRSPWRILMLFIMVTIGVMLLFWLYLNMQANMQVNARNAQIQLPQQLDVKIAVANALQAHARGDVNTEIKVDQQIPIALQGRYLADLKFQVTTPISVDIDYKTNIDIQTVMPLHITTDLVYPSKLLPKLPLKIDVPINLTVPFHLKRTYQLPIKIQFAGAVDLDFNEQLNLDIGHLFRPQLALNDAIEMHNISNFNAVMENISTNTQADIEMNIDVPFKAVHQ